MLVLFRKSNVFKLDVWSSGFLREGVIILERLMGVFDNNVEEGCWKII